MTAAASTSRGELGAQLHLALPLAAQQAGMVLMGLVDAAILGRYHPDALAGAGIGNGLVFAVSCVGLGVVLGLDPLLAQAIGAGESRRTPRLLGDGLGVALRLGVLLTLIVLATPFALDLAGVDPAVRAEAKVFIYARAIGVVPYLLQVTLRGFLQAHGRTWPLVVAVVIGNLVNALLDWILVFGDRGLHDLGLPALGVPAFGAIGAAIATSVVTIATAVFYAAECRAVARTLPPDPAPPRSSARAILDVGVPIGLQLAAEVGAFALAAVLAGRLGRTPAAAHQVALQLASLSFSVALGVGATAAVRVGRSIGAGDPAAARRAGLVSLGLGAAVMATSAACFIALPVTLAHVFTDRAKVIAAAVPLIQIAAVFQLSDGAQAIGAGALRGAGDTRATFVANLIGHYAIGLPVALALAFAAGWGAPGLWWGLTAGLTATGVVLIGRFLWLTARPITRVEDP